MFSCEYCEILTNTYFEVELQTVTSVIFETYFLENLKKIVLGEEYAVKPFFQNNS